MKRILYTGGTVLTGSRIADAVVAFAGELARRETSATIDIPSRTASGTLTHTQMLIGPASQFVVEEAPEDTDELVDDDIVASIVASMNALGTPHPVPDTAIGFPVIDEESRAPDPRLPESTTAPDTLV